ncbi:MAG: molybdenum cofactor guanylyltransferase [Saprospiraceae bacterium]
MANNKLTGIVICGGKSYRFGQDKGMYMLGDKPMIQYAIDNISTIADDIIISTNDPEYANLGYETIEDRYKDIGPIGGIMAALEYSQNENNIIVSCDMPFLNSELLKYIYNNKENHLAASATFNNFVEPLCSYFNKNTGYYF